jgi:uncharacterized protein (DUF1778 family)
VNRLATASSSRKIARLEARIPVELKTLLGRAAALQSQSLTDFVVASAVDAARQVIRESEVLELTQRDQVAFAQALLNPPKISPKLREAARRYRHRAR